MYCVYILKSPKKYYIGYTSNLEQRINDHVSGRAGWTRRNGHWTLCYHESYKSRQEAMGRERFLKSLKNRKVLEEIIQFGKVTVKRA